MVNPFNEKMVLMTRIEKAIQNLNDIE